MKKIKLKGNDFNEKIVTLKELKVDNINWRTYYLDEKSNEKWVKEYPESEYHGGGRPQLRIIEKFPWED